MYGSNTKCYSLGNHLEDTELSMQPIYRCYMKYNPKWKHYDLTLKRQREILLQKGLGLKEYYVEEHIAHGLPQKNDLSIPNFGVYDLAQGCRGGYGLRNGNHPKKAICYWYFDLFDRDNKSLMELDTNKGDVLLTADFTTDFSSYGISPRLIAECCEGSRFYQRIYELSHTKMSVRDIAKKVSTENMSIRGNSVCVMKNYWGL